MNQNQSATKDAFKDGAKDIKTQGSKGVGNFSEGASDKLSDKAGDLYNNAKEMISTAGDKFSQGYEVASSGVRSAGTQFEGIVKRNPLLAVTVAAGLGWAVGRMLSGKSATERA